KPETQKTDRDPQGDSEASYLGRFDATVRSERRTQGVLPKRTRPSRWLKALDTQHSMGRGLMRSWTRIRHPDPPPICVPTASLVPHSQTETAMLQTAPPHHCVGGPKQCREQSAY